jgi:hypothetical protein
LRNFLSNPLYIPPKNWAAKLENIILNNNALHGYFWKSMQINGFMTTNKVAVRIRRAKRVQGEAVGWMASACRRR